MSDPAREAREWAERTLVLLTHGAGWQAILAREVEPLLSERNAAGAAGGWDEAVKQHQRAEAAESKLAEVAAERDSLQADREEDFAEIVQQRDEANFNYRTTLESCRHEREEAARLRAELETIRAEPWTAKDALGKQQWVAEIRQQVEQRDARIAELDRANTLLGEERDAWIVGAEQRDARVKELEARCAELQQRSEDAFLEEANAVRVQCAWDVCMYCGGRAPGWTTAVGPNSAGNWTHGKIGDLKRLAVLCPASAIHARIRSGEQEGAE